VNIVESGKIRFFGNAGLQISWAACSTKQTLCFHRHAKQATGAALLGGLSKGAQRPSAKGAEYESQGQGPNKVRRVAPGMSAQ